ncbi:GyrI-like domain-containing protein [Candidatus Peregrinibacteria bacterium]|nr:GyrI-like domain-containing protein [Candidatus Peregrinibacteria bacterium]
MRKIISIIVFIILLAIGFLGYMGLFGDINVVEKEVGPYIFAYEDFVGDYAKTGPVFDEINDNLLLNGVETSQGLGIYYDDPEVVMKENLKSRVGAIVSEEQAFQIDGRGLKHKIMTVDKFNAVTVEFPLKNMLSIIIGVKKAYPALSDYMDMKGYKNAPAYEIYDYDKGVILYAFPIIK